MLRCNTNSAKLVSPGGPVSRQNEICAVSPLVSPAIGEKNVISAPSQTGLETNFVATVGAACKFLQHGKSPHPLFFPRCGECCFCACIGHCEPTVAFAVTEIAASAQ